MMAAAISFSYAYHVRHEVFETLLWLKKHLFLPWVPHGGY